MQEEEKKKPNTENSGDGMGPISRRDFALGTMAILGTSSGANAKSITQIPAKTAAQAGIGAPTANGLVASSTTRTIQFTVNGWKYEIQAEPEWALRDVLRDRLGFLSIKDMCNGYGACGSCTVIMNGRPILSCMTLAIECNGAVIETAEAVAAAKPNLIEAYVMNHCMQCGYCTPGFVVTAKALLDRNPKPTEADIREALGSNICRCGTYPQHILAIKEATSGTVA